MSWLIKPERNLREGLVRVLKRNRICSVRGRVSSGGLEPEKGKYVWDGDHQYETLRKLYGRYGVRLLGMCEVTPKWNDPDGGSGTKSLLQHLNETVRSWETISRRWGKLWADFEIWNEPDNNGYFNGGAFKNRCVPADQYTQFAKAIPYAFHKTGGQDAARGRLFLDLGARRQFLDHAPRVSSSGGSERVSRMRGQSQFPFLFLAARNSGTSRRNAQLAGEEREGIHAHLPDRIRRRPLERREEAVDVDCRTGYEDDRSDGLRRRPLLRVRFFCPLPGGNDWRFGLINYNGSPEQKMAGCVQAVHALSGRPYLGDLRCADRSVKLARVFSGAEDGVVVLFTGKTNSEQVVKLTLPVQRVEGAGGRRLKPALDGRVPIPDGLAYVYVKRAVVGPFLVKDTRAMRLWKLAQQPPPKRFTPSPIILQPRLDKKFFAPTYTGYRVLPEAPARRLPVTVRVFNHGDTDYALKLAATNPDLGNDTRALAQASLKVPARSSRAVTLPVDATKGYRQGRKQTLWITARSDGGKNISPLVIDLKGELRLKEMMSYFASSTPLPIREIDRWTNSGKSDARFSRAEDGGWRLDGKSDAVARFRLPEKLDLAKADGFVIRAKCRENAKVWFSALDAAGKALFHFPSTLFLATDKTDRTSETFIHRDGKWHTAYVPPVAGEPTGNDKPARLAQVQLGLKDLSGEENALVVSDLLIVRTTATATAERWCNDTVGSERQGLFRRPQQVAEMCRRVFSGIAAARCRGEFARSCSHHQAQLCVQKDAGRRHGQSAPGWRGESRSQLARDALQDHRADALTLPGAYMFPFLDEKCWFPLNQLVAGLSHRGDDRNGQSGRRSL